MTSDASNSENNEEEDEDEDEESFSSDDMASLGEDLVKTRNGNVLHGSIQAISDLSSNEDQNESSENPEIVHLPIQKLTSNNSSNMHEKEVVVGSSSAIKSSNKQNNSSMAPI